MNKLKQQIEEIKQESKEYDENAYILNKSLIKAVKIIEKLQIEQNKLEKELQKAKEKQDNFLLEQINKIKLIINDIK